MDKCKEEFEETFKKLNKISLSDHAVIFGYPKREEAFFNAAWQEQQKRVDAVKQLIEEYRDPPTEDKTFQHALSIVADELEQALKGEGQ